jgi:hypothetical protein
LKPLKTLHVHISRQCCPNEAHRAWWVRGCGGEGSEVGGTRDHCQRRTSVGLRSTHNSTRSERSDRSPVLKEHLLPSGKPYTTLYYPLRQSITPTGFSGHDPGFSTIHTVNCPVRHYDCQVVSGRRSEKATQSLSELVNSASQPSSGASFDELSRRREGLKII